MNIYECKLSLPVNFIPSFDENMSVHTPFNVYENNSSLVDFLSGLNIKVVHSERFCFHPDYYTHLPIHVDDIGDGGSADLIKINYVYSQDYSYTRWYKLKNGKDVFSIDVLKTAVNTGYRVASYDECDLVHTMCIRCDPSPILFNAGELHSVDPVSAPRYTFSMVLANKSTGRLLSWKEACFLLKDFINESK